MTEHYARELNWGMAPARRDGLVRGVTAVGIYGLPPDNDCLITQQKRDRFCQLAWFNMAIEVTAIQLSVNVLRAAQLGL